VTERQARAQTGIPGLDDILMGGLIPNQLHLIDGDPGSGKTTLALQFLMQGAKLNERGLYVTLSETRAELLAGVESHGWSLDLEKIEIVELVRTEEDLEADAQLTMYQPQEVELTETTKAVLEAVDRSRPSRVVFDSLSELRLLAQNSLRYRRQILALKQFFVGRHCTVLLLDDRTSEVTDTQLQSIAHGVISLEQLSPLYGAERRRLRITKMRGAKYRGGYHDFTIRTGGIEVFPRLVAAEHRGEIAPSMIASGVPEIDRLLGGGLDRGTSTILMGPAGCGKSTVAIQYAIAAAQRGEHAEVFAFDESIGTLKKRMGGLGATFREGSGPGEIGIHQVDPAELSPGELASHICRAVSDRKATVVIIDSLNGYLNAMPEERFLVLQLHELLSYLGSQGVCTILVIAQHGILDGPVQSPIDTSYLADSVILFRYFENAGRISKVISVVKKRGGPHEDTIRCIRFDGEGIHVSQPLRDFRGVLTGARATSSGQSGARPRQKVPR
jgi:circadian clock protein KaiC